MQNTIIETKRLILRPWQMTDINDIVEGLNNFDTAKNLTTPFPYTNENAIDFINKHLKNDDKNFYYAIVLRDNNKVIGGTSLELKPNNRNKGGIWLNQKYTGKGYGTEVWKARAEFAFYTLGLSELENGFYDFNEKSWHMQQKLGYKKVGQTVNFCPALNNEVVEIITRLTKEDFETATKKDS